MSSPILPVEGKTQAELDAEVRREVARRTRRSFLIGGAAALATWGGYEWLAHSPQMNQLQLPLRGAERWNARVSRGLFRERVLVPEYAPSRATMLRVNGDIGIDDLVPESWRLQVVGLDRPRQYKQFTPDVDLWEYRYAGDSATGSADSGGVDLKGSGSKQSPAQQAVAPSTGMTQTPGVLLTMADLRALPAVDMVTEFKCIEGWSQICAWRGARFSDFFRAWPPARGANGRWPKYVAMETTEGDFFSGYDLAGLMHPQTLLCYQMGGAPLTMAHGAPLRLAMPIKYGYKQIKQIAKITYTDVKPPDYWANLGYDWYGGL